MIVRSEHGLMLGALQIPFRVLEHFAVADVIEMRVRQDHCVDVGGLKTDLVKLSRNRSGNDAADAVTNNFAFSISRSS